MCIRDRNMPGEKRLHTDFSGNITKVLTPPLTHTPSITVLINHINTDVFFTYWYFQLHIPYLERKTQ